MNILDGLIQINASIESALKQADKAPVFDRSMLIVASYKEALNTIKPLLSFKENMPLEQWKSMSLVIENLIKQLKPTISNVQEKDEYDFGKEEVKDIMPKLTEIQKEVQSQINLLSDIRYFGSDENASQYFRVVHGPSKGGSFAAILGGSKPIKAGDVVGGDFNINLLELAKNLEIKDDTIIKDEMLINLAALEQYLKEKKLKLEMTEEAIKNFHPFFKMRSASSVYSQQPLKNGEPDVFIKDFVGKITENNNNENPIPDSFKTKIKELSKAAALFKDKLKETNLNSKEDVQKLSDIFKITNYYNTQQSGGNDHPCAYYIDDQKQTIFFTQNSLKQTDYNYQEHFNAENLDGKKLKNPRNVEKIYAAYDKVVYKEMLQLLVIRGDKDAGKQKNEAEIKDYVNQKLSKDTSMGKDKTKQINEIHLKNFFTNIISSPEFEAVNRLLKVDVMGAKTREEVINERLLSSEAKEIYFDSKNSDPKPRLDKAMNAMYQSLNPDPKAKGQPIALSGTGFAPFTDEEGNLLLASDLENLQIKSQIQSMNSLADANPTYQLMIGQIECDKQENKCNELEKAVLKINAKAKATIMRLSSMERMVGFFGLSSQRQSKLLNDHFNQGSLEMEEEASEKEEVSYTRCKLL